MASHPRTLDAATVDLDSVDLTDLDLWVEGPPHALFARMRSEAPVRWNPTANGPPFWSLTRGVDVAAVSTDPATFSTNRGGIFLRDDALASLDYARNFPIFKDPPEHTRYRDVVAKAFLPRTMLLIDEMVRDIVTQTLDQVVQRGECDLVHDIAVPIPVCVIGRLMGAPDEDIDQLLTWTDDIERGITYSRDVTASLEQMANHLIKLVDQQVVRGLDTLAHAIAEAEVEGQRLSPAEIAVYFGMLLYAGNGPTRNAISAGMLALLEHPDQLRLLQREPGRLRTTRSGLASVALQEILRWTTPVNYFARTATQATTLGGKQVKAGDRVVMWYPAANRDPDLFPDAESFNIAREVRDLPHYAFGGGGPHFCQGAFLAHKMLSVTLSEIVKRMADIEPAGPITRSPSAFVNSLTSLPVKFTAVK